MTTCPSDTKLQELLADSMPAEEQLSFDAHLGACQRCKDRLEELADVKGMSRVLGGAAVKPMTESMSLKMVMERLQSESSDMMTALTTPGGSGRSKATLPALQPTMMTGFMGRLGDIQIKRLIGRGGMGVVFEGLDTILNRTVAVKVLSPHLLDHTESKNRFLREAQAAAALHHVNVVTIHAISEVDGMPYLLLQYVEGESLADRLIREKKLPLEDVVRIGIQVARGLAAAHDRGLVHRDIKPANILLEREKGDVRITDFGLAKTMGMESVTAVGMLAGTPAYMSPEQAADGVVDGRSDLFSLGVMLYQASTGELPFPAESPFVLLSQIRSMAEKPLKELNPELPEWFCSIVHRLLRKQPENRFATATEVVEALERRVGVEAAQQRKMESGPGWPLTLISLLVVAGLTVAGYLSLSGRSEAKKSSGLEAAGKAVVPGFVVLGNTTRFETLNEAVQAAPDQSVIEVFGEGPFMSPTIKVEGKRLTIRAAMGSHPRFVPDPSADGGFYQFLTSSSDVRLEGLEIFWPVTPSLSKLDDPGQRAVVYSLKNKLTLIHCRIVCGNMAACAGSIGQDLEIEHCHLSAQGGVCIGWRSNDLPVKIVHNVFEGKTMMNIVRSSTTSSTVRKGVYLANNLVTTDRCFQIMVENNVRNTTGITAVRNVFDCSSLVTLVTLPKFGFNISLHEVMNQVVQLTTAWTEEDNIYRKRIAYLTGARIATINNLSYSDYKTLSAWLKVWKMEKSRSVEGTIRLESSGKSGDTQPAQLGRVEAPSGPLPVDYGVDGKAVGPGKAYDAWRRRQTMGQ